MSKRIPATIAAMHESVCAMRERLRISHFWIENCAVRRNRVRFGQKQTFGPRKAMSALLPKADIVGRNGDVRFVPKLDIGLHPTIG
jgi:hypothetical protein